MQRCAIFTTSLLYRFTDNLKCHAAGGNRCQTGKQKIFLPTKGQLVHWADNIFRPLTCVCSSVCLSATNRCFSVISQNCTADFPRDGPTKFMLLRSKDEKKNVTKIGQSNFSWQENTVLPQWTCPDIDGNHVNIFFLLIYLENLFIFFSILYLNNRANHRNSRQVCFLQRYHTYLYFW